MSAATGKHIRLNRLIQAESNTCLIVAIDHGMTSPVFLDGLYDTGRRIHESIAAAPTCSCSAAARSSTTCNISSATRRWR